MQFALVDLLIGKLTDRFEATDHIEILVDERLTAFLAQPAFGEHAVNASGQNCAAVDEHAWAIDARDRHEAARHILVASSDGNEPVKTFAAHHGLNRIGDHFSRNERVFHSLGAHRDAVGNGDRAKDECLSPCPVHAGFRLPRESIDVHVARRDHAPG